MCGADVMLMSVRFEVQISRVARDAPVVIENESSIFSPSTPGVDVNGTGRGGGGVASESCRIITFRSIIASARKSVF